MVGIDSDSRTDPVQRYIAAAMAHHTATKDGNYRSANASADTLVDCCAEILGDSGFGSSALMVLMRHKEPCVRIWAARDSLPFSENEAVEVLKALSGRSDLIGFDAEMVLREWKAGRLRHPSPDSE